MLEPFHEEGERAKSTAPPALAGTNLYQIV
jgi:hypothetical protein